MSKSSFCEIPEFRDKDKWTGFFRHLTNRELALGPRAQARPTEGVSPDRVAPAEPEHASRPATGKDFDLYLVRNAVWPLILEALEGLARKIEFKADRHELRDFNALHWLGQYLVRNHPGKASVRDTHRQACFHQLKRLSQIEHGRREFIRRKSSVETEFNKFLEHNEEKKLQVREIESLIVAIDKSWCVDSKLLGRCQGIPYPRPKPIDDTTSSEERDALAPPAKRITFQEFWEWLLTVGEEPEGLLDPEIFQQGDAKRAILDAERRLLEKQRRKEEKLRITLEETKELETAFLEVVHSIKADTVLIEMFDALEFQFPKTAGAPPEAEHFLRLRSLLEFWYKFSFPEGCQLPEGIVPVTKGCAWNAVVKFFRSLRKDGEADLDIVHRLLDTKEFEKLHGKRPGVVQGIFARKMVDESTATVISTTTGAAADQLTDPGLGQVEAAKQSGPASIWLATVVDTITGESKEVEIPAEDVPAIQALLYQSQNDSSSELQLFVNIDDNNLLDGFYQSEMWDPVALAGANRGSVVKQKSLSRERIAIKDGGKK